MRSVLATANRTRVASLLAGAVAPWPQEGRSAAVLVPLLEAHGEPAVLFTVRSNKMSQHRGQVSFPGGVADPGDCSAAGTALREAEEELGLASSSVDVWGELPSIPDRMLSTVITPVVGNLGALDLSTLQPNSMEVDSVFVLPLSHLASPLSRRSTCFRPYFLQFPVFLGGPRKIWGLTAFILDLVLTHILPPHHKYSPMTRFIS